MKHSAKSHCAIFATSVGLKLALLSTGTAFLEIGPLSSRADAETRLGDCRETLLQGSLREVRLLRCENGKYYRRVGGRYIETDNRGNAIASVPPKAASGDSGNEDTTLRPANPDFKSAPTAGDQP